MEAPQWVRDNPFYSATFVVLFICATFVQPLWSLFTDKPLVPTVAGWLGLVVSDISLMWLPFIGVPVGLFMLYGIWRETKKRPGATAPVSKPVGPIRIVGSERDSQIFRPGQTDLQLRIAVKFENSDPPRRIIRGFNAFMVSAGGSRQPLNKPDVRSVVSPNPGKLSLESGIPVDQGISPLHYIDFYVPHLDEPSGETFQIEAEIMGQDNEVIEVIPNWYQINQSSLANTVKEIRNGVIGLVKGHCD